MRKFNLLLKAAVMAAAFTSVGQVVGQPLGTKTLYGGAAAAGASSAAGNAYTQPPAGYAPVFIDYVGRHGARFLTKAGPEIGLQRVLGEADRAGGLTELGRRVLWAAGLLRDAAKDKYEQITILGAEEQAAIGERMRLQYGGVFRGRGLEVVTTFKLRTQQSAEAFLHGFGEYGGARRFVRLPDSLDVNLRFYDLSPGYTRYKKGALIARCMDTLERDGRNEAVVKSVCGRLFLAGALPGLKDGSALVGDLYDCYAISGSMKGELREPGVQSALGAAFGAGDLAWLSMVDGAGDFLEKGPGFDSLGIQVGVAAPLLVDFVKTVDKAVDGDAGPDAVLRFTHAEAISPFAALMGIQGASEASRSILNYRKRWQAEAVIPLSANIQWIIYRKSRGDALVKVLLNEREVFLPVKGYGGNGPYYRWKELRGYFMGKLKGLGVRPGDDMLRYLAGLKEER
nr:histidine phosphatase family protein [Nostoc sp. PA-18-2419]